MQIFDASEIACEQCGEAQPRLDFCVRCRRCGGDRFRVAIERATEGVDWSVLFSSGVDWYGTDRDFDPSALEVAGVPDLSDLFFRTHSVLSVGGVSGEEVLRFLRAPLQERRRHFVSWKRRETEARLVGTQTVCIRCGTIFAPYNNPWNGAGCCSRVCYRIALRMGPPLF